MVNITLQEIGNVIASIADYERIANYLPGLDPQQRETLEIAWARAVKHSKSSKYMDHDAFQYWKNINLFIVRQTWGSTACGWEGIGGAAFSESYTVIIECSHNKMAFVYYNAQLAYIIETDENYHKHKATGFINMPGMSSVKSKLTVIYKKRK